MTSDTSPHGRAPAPPVHPIIARMDLWHVPLEIDERLADAAARVLDDAERARAQRFAHPHDRRRWIAARAALRHILGAACSMPSDQVRFRLGEHGKPELGQAGDAAVHPGAPDAPAFNLSHSGVLALIVVCDRPVGVDLELLERADERHEDIQSVFSPAERAAIAAAPLTQRPLASYRCWTRKEALLKAAGCGFALDDTTRFTVSIDAQAKLLGSNHRRLAMGEWSLRALEQPGTRTGAVAVRGAMPPCTEHHWHWPA